MENSPRGVEFFRRADAYLARIANIEAKRKEEQRAGRKDGLLGKSLRDSLRACNVAQLGRVKTVCNRFIEDHRRPPDESECGAVYIMKVLASVCVKNRRYQLEIRRGSLRRKTVYLNGPYLYAYWRDGRLIRKQYLKKGRDASIPRKVKEAIKPFESVAVIEAELQAIVKSHGSKDQREADESAGAPAQAF
jgi:hypothetical protein